MKVYNFSSQSKGIDFPEYDNKLFSYKDFKYFKPSNKKLDVFNEIKKMYENSSLHSSIINNLVQQVKGTGFIPQTPLDEIIIETYNYNEILNKCIFDFVLFGGAYLELILNQEHTKIVKVKHLKYNQVYIGDYDDNPYLDEQTNIFYHCSNWDKWRDYKITPLVRFNPEIGSDNHQILPIFYQNFLDVYPKPYYFSGWRWLQIDVELSKYYLDCIEKVFSPNTMITLPGIIDSEQQQQFEEIFSNNFTGVQGKKSILFNPPTPEMKPEILKFNNDDDGDKYHKWVELTSQQIVSLHNLPSTTLAGISQPGKLGSTEELKTAQDIYNHSKVYPFRTYFIDSFTKINRYLLDPLSQIKIEDSQVEFVEKSTSTAYEIKKIEK